MRKGATAAAVLAWILEASLGPPLGAGEPGGPSIAIVSPAEGQTVQGLPAVQAALRGAPAGLTVVQYECCDAVRYLAVDPEDPMIRGSTKDGAVVLFDPGIPFRPGPAVLRISLWSEAGAGPLASTEVRFSITRPPPGGELEKSHLSSRGLMAFEAKGLDAAEWAFERASFLAARRSQDGKARTALEEAADLLQMYRVRELRGRADDLASVARAFQRVLDPERALGHFLLAEKVYRGGRDEALRHPLGDPARISRRALEEERYAPAFQRDLADFCVRYGRFQDALDASAADLQWAVRTLERKDLPAADLKGRAEAAASRARRHGRIFVALRRDLASYRLWMAKARELAATGTK